MTGQGGAAELAALFAPGAPVPPRQRRRRWPWIVAAVVVVAMLVVAAAVVQSVARQTVEAGVRQQIVSRLGLAADQRVDVSISEPFLLELITGSVREVRVTAEDISVEGFAGDVDVVLRDVDLWGDHRMSPGTATVSMDAGQLRGLLSRVEGFPADAVGLSAPDVTFSVDLRLFGAPVPLAVALTPSAAGGDIVLSPRAATVGGATLTADEVRARFGRLADGALRSWTVCLADRLPAGARLTGVEVTGDHLVSIFGLDGRLVADPALLEPGTC